MYIFRCFFSSLVLRVMGSLSYTVSFGFTIGDVFLAFEKIMAVGAEKEHCESGCRVKPAADKWRQSG